MRLLILLNMLFIATLGEAQINGKITDKSSSERLIGASIRGGTQYAISDMNGNFVINAIVGDTVRASLLGYQPSTVVINPGVSFLDIQLEPATLQLDEIIVTGVFDPRKRIESSVAITTLSTKQLERIVPNSSAELLRNVPGVFVQSARGELRNQIISRGMVLNGGENFVSFQEDGLPISGPAGLGPTSFLRTDVNLSKLEALRGGSASILGINAPGGIFNYISKTGGDHFEGVVSTRLGLEGNGKNPYYRLEGNIGGPINKNKDLTYNIGGHLRYANGAKYPGYPLSHGGQIKGNILKKFATGSLKLNIKVLDDHTKDFEFTPTQGFDDPHPAGSFTTSSSVLVSAVKKTFLSNGDGIHTVDFDTKSLNHLKDYAASLQWEQRFGDSWKMTQSLKYSQKSSIDRGTFIVYPTDLTAGFSPFIFDMINEGKYRFYNATTKQNYGTLTQKFDFTLPAFPYIQSSFNGNLPGSDILQNGVFFTQLTNVENKVSDVFYQQTISKVWKNMKLTGGFYSNRSHLNYYNSQEATSISTIQDKPQLIGIEYTPADGSPVKQVTDKDGIGWYHWNPLGTANTNEITTLDNAIYFGHQWNITPNLNLDWGGRFEWLLFTNKYRLATFPEVSTTGGMDRNPLTLYDNYTVSLNPPKSYSKNASTGSYSAGLNYVKSKNLAFYVRFSSGNKLPDISTYVSNQTAGDVSRELPQKTIQIEGGVKYQSKDFAFTATPFVSILSNIPYSTWESDTNGVLYNLPILYNKLHAQGIELEASFNFDSHWSIRANGVIQHFVTDKYQTWEVGGNGSGDNKIIDYSGKSISFFAAPYIFNVTPVYQNKKVFAGINYYSLSRRAANPNEAFFLPAFSQLDLNLGYAISTSISLKFAINNLLNKFGIMDWTAPVRPGGLFFDTFNTGDVTKESIKANPNTPYFTMGIQPRSFFLDFTVKL